MIRILLALAVVGGIFLFVTHTRGRHNDLIRPFTDAKAWKFLLLDEARATMAQDGDGVRCDITNSGRDFGGVLLYQVAVPIENDRTYRLRFTARADKDMVIIVDGCLDHFRFDNIGLSTVVPLSKEWQTYQYVFIGEHADGKPDRVPQFAMGKDRGSVWIKDVHMEVVK